MSIHDDINELNSRFNDESAPITPAIMQTRQHEIAELLTQHETLVQAGSRQQQRQYRNFMVFGPLLAVVGGLSFLALTLPISSWLVVVLGVFSGLMATIFTLRSLGPNGLDAAEERIDKVYARLTRDARRADLQKRQVQSPLSSRRRSKKLIAGVAATLAEKMDVPVGLVRFAFIILTFMSSGTFLVPYFIAAAVIHAMDEHRNRPA